MNPYCYFCGDILDDENTPLNANGDKLTDCCCHHCIGVTIDVARAIKSLQVAGEVKK